jgi:hypothetical protein
MKRTVVCSAVVVAAVTSLTGCVHFYSKANDDLAKAVQDNYTKAKITDVLSVEAKNQTTLQTHEADALSAYTKALRDIELHRLVGSADPAAFAFVNGQIGVALRQLGIKPGKKPRDLTSLISSSRVFRAELDHVLAATKVLGAAKVQSVPWCDSLAIDDTEILKDVDALDQPPSAVDPAEIRKARDAKLKARLKALSGGQEATSDAVALYPDYLKACRAMTTARGDLRAQIAAVELEVQVVGTVNGAPALAVFDADARADIGARAESLSDCLKRRDLYVIDRPVIDVSHPLTGTPTPSAPPSAAAMQPKNYRDLDVPPSMRRAPALAPTPPGASSTSATPAAATNTEPMGTRAAAERRPDSRIASVIDLEGCIAAIAPRRLTKSMKQLAQDEEDLVRRRAAVDLANEVYKKAAADAEAATAGSQTKSALGQSLERLACLLIEPKPNAAPTTPPPAESDALPTEKTAAAAAGPATLATLAKPLGFDLSKCDAPAAAGTSSLPALAQQYLAEAAVDVLTKRLNLAGEKGMTLDCSKLPAGTTGENKQACEAVDNIARKIMLEQDQKKDLKLAELTVKKQYYKVLEDQALKAVSRAEALIALRDTQVLAALDELEYLMKALDDLGLEDANIGANACPKPGLTLCTPVGDALGGKVQNIPDNSRISLVRSISHYLDSVTIGRAAYEVADVQIKNVTYLRALDDSQFALVAYDALLSSPLTLLVKYHASGVTPSDIAQIAQVLGIAAIAAK